MLDASDSLVHASGEKIDAKQFLRIELPADTVKPAVNGHYRLRNACLPRESRTVLAIVVVA